MDEIKVIFKTLTPLWTGDAWGENTKIRPSSLMGSLRFWFEVHCKSIGISIGKLSVNGTPSDNLEEYVKEYNKNNNTKETFNSLLEKQVKINNDYNEAVKNVLKQLQIPLPSVVFGCTGWKGKIKINEVNCSEYKLRKSDIDFFALYNILQNIRTQNSKFWANKILFGNKNEIILFENIEINLSLSQIVENEFKKFLKFYKDKIIIVGGKKSFGFGFCRLSTNLDLASLQLPNEKRKLFDSTNFAISNLPQGKKVLGFNFKHYQRLKEQKTIRETNFGKQGKASNFSFSAYLSEGSKIYLIGFNEYKDNILNTLLKKYSNFKEEK